MNRRHPRLSYASQGAALRLWIPAAYGASLAGFSVSILRFLEGRHAAFEDLLISDLLSPKDNPRGWGWAAFALVIGSLLLFPVAAVLTRSGNGRGTRWTGGGGWLFALGLLATMTVGAVTPFQEPYIPLHVTLSFAALIAMMGGLTLCLGVSLSSASAGRAALACLLALHFAGLLYLALLVIHPGDLMERRWLALYEWGSCALIAAGIPACVAASQPPRKTRDPIRTA